MPSTLESNDIKQNVELIDWRWPVGLGLVCVALAWWVLRAGRGDFKVPFYALSPATHFPLLNFDVNLYLAIAKNIQEGGWIGEFPRLGAPGVMTLYDYPFPFFQQNVYACLKLFCLAGMSFGQAVNLFFLLTFPAAALASYALFRIWGISRLVCACAAVLFAFLPYHFHTGQMHLALSSYICVPLSLIACQWIREGHFPKRRLLAALGILLVIATSDMYYTAYAGLVFLATGVLSAVHAETAPERRKVLKASLGMTLSQVCLSVLFLGPVLWHKLQHPSDVFFRFWIETETWGIKLIQFLIPIREHYWGPFANLSQRYNGSGASNVNESVALGVIGSVGLLVLLWRLVVNRREYPAQPVLFYLTQLNAVCLLTAMVGGLATMIAFWLSPEIRANYRLGIYIGLFSIAAVAVLVDTFRKKRMPAKREIWLNLGIVCMTLLGVLDQTGPLVVPPYETNVPLFRAQEMYFKRLEAALPPGTAVFQLPYAPFPEGGPMGRGKKQAQMYEQFTPFLHTTSLRFSYGALKGQKVAYWQDVTAGLADSSQGVSGMAGRLCEAGFGAVLLDSAGFKEKRHFAGLARQLPEVTGNTALASPDGRYLAYRICERWQP